MKIDHLREMKTVVVLEHTPYHLVTGVPIINEAGGNEEKTCSVLVREEDVPIKKKDDEAESKRSMAFTYGDEAASLQAITNAIGVKSSLASATAAMTKSFSLG